MELGIVLDICIEQLHQGAGGPGVLHLLSQLLEAGDTLPKRRPENGYGFSLNVFGEGKNSAPEERCSREARDGVLIGGRVRRMIGPQG